MSFMGEIAAALGLDKSSIANGYQIVNYNGNAVYAEGFKRVLSIGVEEVVLGLKAGRIRIAGQNLSVKELEKDSLIVCGKITSYTEENL